MPNLFRALRSLWVRTRLRSQAKQEAEKRIKKLENAIAQILQETFNVLPDNADPLDYEVAESQFEEQTSGLQNLLDHYQQEPLRQELEASGIDVREEHYSEEKDGDSYRTLSSRGISRLKRELRKNKLAEWKDWIAVLSPLWSALIAILGLLVALKKK